MLFLDLDIKNIFVLNSMSQKSFVGGAWTQDDGGRGTGEDLPAETGRETARSFSGMEMAEELGYDFSDSLAPAPEEHQDPPSSPAPAAARRGGARPLPRAMFDVVSLRCGHHFHLNCLNTWIERVGTGGHLFCPPCRQPVDFEDANCIQTWAAAAKYSVREDDLLAERYVLLIVVLSLCTARITTSYQEIPSNCTRRTTLLQVRVDAHLPMI